MDSLQITSVYNFNNTASTAQKWVTSRVLFPMQRESRHALCDSRRALRELHSTRIIEAVIFGINYFA